MASILLVHLFALLIFYLPALSQPIRPNGSDRREITPVQPDSRTFRLRARSRCSPLFRTFDGTCTTFGSPAKKVLGSSNRPHYSYFIGRDATSPRPLDLRSPRYISNVLCAQSKDVFDGRRLSEMATFFGQFLDHTIVATSTNPNERFDIPVPEDDPVMANTSHGMPFFRSIRVRVTTRDNSQRPSNTLSSAIDLASVYGPSKERSDALRESKGGLMKMSKGGLLPLNTAGLNNAPRAEKRFFVAGDHRANEHPVLTSLHTIFLREHNSLAKELKKAFPKAEDEFIFRMARKINGAQMQKIVFEEWYPAMTDETMGRFRGFSSSIDPTVSLVFSTAGFRVGHTMVGNRVHRRGKGNKKLKSFGLKDMFFNSAETLRKHGVDEFLRGALVNRAQKIDLRVHNSLRNFLFTGVRGEEGIDLIAMNLQRGRDHNIPSFNGIRIKFQVPKAVKFSDITKNRNVQSALRAAYENPGRVEAWVGLMAEDHAPGSSMGITMLNLWRAEFRRYQRGDSFYYLNEGVFTEAMKKKIPRVQALYSSEECFRAILLRNTEISDEELPKRMFFA